MMRTGLEFRVFYGRQVPAVRAISRHSTAGRSLTSVSGGSSLRKDPSQEVDGYTDLSWTYHKVCSRRLMLAGVATLMLLSPAFFGYLRSGNPPVVLKAIAITGALIILHQLFNMPTGQLEDCNGNVVDFKRREVIMEDGTVLHLRDGG